MNFLGKTGKEVFPGSSIEGAELKEFVRNASMTNSHWSGSTKMGTKRDFAGHYS